MQALAGLDLGKVRSRCVKNGRCLIEFDRVGSGVHREAAKRLERLGYKVTGMSSVPDGPKRYGADISLSGGSDGN